MPKRNKSWKDQLHNLEQRKNAIQHLVQEYDPKASPDLLRELSDIRSQQDELSVQEQQLSERVEAIGEVLADRWEKEGITSMNVEGLGTYSIQTRLHVSTRDREAFHQWLRDNNLDTLITDYVAPKRAEALVRERLEEGLPCDGIGLAVHFTKVVR